ncbi:MAG: hypothetical protein Q4E53_05955 [Eubacteriales bacterium]|nr:hypothetical protein [Eubacteriales bacterium]
MKRSNLNPVDNWLTLVQYWIDWKKHRENVCKLKQRMEASGLTKRKKYQAKLVKEKKDSKKAFFRMAKQFVRFLWCAALHRFLNK